MFTFPTNFIYRIAFPITLYYCLFPVRLINKYTIVGDELHIYMVGDCFLENMKKKTQQQYNVFPTGPRVQLGQCRKEIYLPGI